MAQIPTSLASNLNATQRYVLIIEYDGGPFFGWQVQNEGPSVQGAIEQALFKFCGLTLRVHCAGRTDSGVHGLAMPMHVDLPGDKVITPFKLMAALNACLRPQPIAILAAMKVSQNFHARFSCTERRYEYRLANRRGPATLEQGRTWVVHPNLQVEAMRLAANSLLGYHDFSTFRAAACQAKSPWKNLDQLDIEAKPSPFGGQNLCFQLRARSFLHNQVRAMVGSLVKVGLGQWSQTEFQVAFAAKDRRRGGQNAPPEGLYFAGAKFDISSETDLSSQEKTMLTGAKMTPFEPDPNEVKTSHA